MKSTNGSDSRRAMSRSSRRKLPPLTLNQNRERSVPEYPKKKRTGLSENSQRGSRRSRRDNSDQPTSGPAHSVRPRYDKLGTMPSPFTRRSARITRPSNRITRRRDCGRHSTGVRRSKLPRSFYLRPTLTVAKDLLGKNLFRRIGNRFLIGKIVEVEAYLGELDPASHAYRGMTPRNEVMFRAGGHLYVYFTYGMHFCCNVVTEQKGKGRAVLLRAVEPVEGIDLMVRNREWTGIGKSQTAGHFRDPQKGNQRAIPPNLTNGPAKLCQAFGIARNQNGTDLLGG